MLLFGVIYSVDCNPRHHLKQYYPPGKICRRPIPSPLPRGTWQITESAPDGTYDEMWGASYKHRKFVGLMTEDLMTQLIKDQCLDWCGCDTMGSLGTMAPDGMMIGLMPAISFRCSGDGYDLDAYITPYVVRADGQTPLRKEGMNDRDWDRINDAFLARYAERYRNRIGPFERARRERLLRESRERSKDMVFNTRD